MVDVKSSDLYDRGLLDAGLLTRNSDKNLQCKTSVSIPNLFSSFAANNEPVKICAPMVRYSKLAFRKLVRKYGADLCFTPMIVADSFIKSIKARDSDFTTDFENDRPLIVQFAAKDCQQIGDAAEIVKPFCDGIDINCGCPQRWAIQDGLGCCLLKKPELIHDMVKTVRNRIPDTEFNVSVKIRISENLQETVKFCQQAERAGVSMISIHGRTPSERHQPVHYDKIRTVCDSLQVPCVANGDIKTIGDVKSMQELTRCQGVMVATGLLKNPALFAGFTSTPRDCISDWIHIATSVGTPFTCFHHHLMDMTEKIMSKSDRYVFNALTSNTAVVEFFHSRYGI